jgi:hypothetical protein
MFSGGPVRRAPALALITLAAAGCSSDTPEPPARIGAEIVLDHAVKSRPLALEDSLFVGPPGDLLFVDDELFIVEPRGHRISVLDTTLAVLRMIGRFGEGPGELQSPINIDRTPLGRVAVAEVGNSRISVFETDGRFVATYRPSGRRGVLALTDTSFLVTQQFPDRKLSRVTRRGAEPFGPVDTSGEDYFQPFQYTFPARLRDGTPLYGYIRNSDLTFEFYDGEGRVVRQVAVPWEEGRDDLARLGDRALEEERKIWGPGLLGRTKVTIGETSSDGRWLPIRYSELETTYLYDIWNDRFHPMRSRHTDNGIAASASVIHGSRFYTYEHQRGLFVYEVDLPE